MLSWIGVECWCDLGANLVQHFTGRYSRYSRYRTKLHDKSTISHDISRYSRYQTVLLKLEEIKNNKLCFLQHLQFCGCCFLSLWELRLTRSVSFGLCRAKNSPQDCFLNALTVHKEKLFLIGYYHQTPKLQGFRGFSFFCVSRFGASWLALGMRAKKVFTNTTFFDII